MVPTLRGDFDERKSLFKTIVMGVKTTVIQKSESRLNSDLTKTSEDLLQHGSRSDSLT